MSTRIMGQCWPLQMRPPAKAVLMSLADMANDEGYCWPSIERLCERTCFGRTAVIEAIAWLESRAILRADRSNGRKTVYWVEPELYVEEGQGGAPAQVVPAAAKLSPNQSAGRTGPPGKPVRHADPTRPPRGLNRSATRTLTVKNHHEPNTPQPPAAARGACGGQGFTSTLQTRTAGLAGEGTGAGQGIGLGGGQGVGPAVGGFEAFWQAYPKQANEDAARREWARLAPDAALQAQLLTALAVQQQSPAWQREAGRYIPMPAKWLAGRRWRDQTPETRTPTLQSLWWQSSQGVRDMGLHLGLPYSMAELGNAYTDDQLLAHNRRYRERIFAAAGPGPWSASQAAGNASRARQANHPHHAHQAHTP